MKSEYLLVVFTTLSAAAAQSRSTSSTFFLLSFSSLLGKKCKMLEGFDVWETEEKKDLRMNTCFDHVSGRFKSLFKWWVS